MARTPSNMLALGTTAADFNLLDTVSGTQKNLNDVRGENGTVIMFICNHCPFVVHVNSELVRVANDYSTKSVGFVAISSNDVINYPQDGPERMTIHARENGYPFPYLYDETQEVAKAYEAACTPDIYLFDRNHELVYRGQLDDSRPGNGLPLSGADLRHALDCLLNNEPNTREQRPSIGCNIKWK